jgi:hypothetical protein
MTDSEKFDNAMRKVLSVSKVDLQRKLDAEKESKKVAALSRSDTH